MYSAHRVTKKKEVESMSRRTVLVLCVLALVPFSLAYGQGGGNGRAMTPVGTWDLEFVAPENMPPPYKVLWTLNFGGTSMVTAQGSPPFWPSGDYIEDWIVGLASWGASTGHGIWKKVGRRTYRHTVFTLVPWNPGEPGNVAELKGYVRAVQEFTMVDKNTLRGRCEISITESRDPMSPSTFVFGVHDFEGKRLKVE
jgi:hypothetical protein